MKGEIKMQFLKYCKKCDSFINKKNKWQKIYWYNWYKRLYIYCVKKGHVEGIGIYHEECDKCFQHKAFYGYSEEVVACNG